MGMRSACVAAVLLVSTSLMIPVATAQTEEPSSEWGYEQITSELNPTRTHEYPSVAINPEDPNTVVVGNIEFTTATCVSHISTDGGRTWTAGASPQPDGYTNCGITNHNFYPTQMSTGLKYGADGTLYFAFAAARETDGLSRSIIVSRSLDDGRSWDPTVVEHGEPGERENAEVHVRPKVAIDPNDPNRVFVAWRFAPGKFTEEPNEAWVAMSTDGGRNFEEPVQLGPGDAPDVVVDGDGTAHVFYFAPGEEEGQSELTVASSDDGQSYEETTIFSAPGISPPSAAVLDGGTTFVAWSDTHLAEEGEVLQAVFTARSTDGGRDWTEPQPIAPVERTDPGNNVNQIYPNVSVSPNGRIDVMWYDYRNDPFPVPDDADASFLGRINDVFLASSSDGGASFGDATRVTRNSIDRRIGTWNSQYFLNARPGIASTDEGVVVAWSDTANGRPDIQGPQDIVAASSLVGADGRAAALTGPDFSWRDWLLAAELFVGGLGIALLVAWIALRRRPAAERERVRT